MKYHRSTVNAVVETVRQIFANGIYADKAIGSTLKQNSKWGSRDRNFIAETCYEMVRWYRLIEESLSEDDVNSIAHYYKLFAVWQLIKGNDLPDWDEFKTINKNKIIDNTERLKSIRKYRESIPDWLDELASNELGEDVWTKELSELNKSAKIVLRVNTLKISLDKLQQKLLTHNIETSKLDGYPTALITDKRQNYIALEEYKQGLFEIQDASSQLVAPFMMLEEGMTVIDACAGAGGKSLQIVAEMNNKGRIISMDLEEKKLIELNKRAGRAGVTIIKSRLITDKEVEQLRNTADRLLLDVPCSGLGVLKRKPYDKWKLSPEYINEKKRIQQKILSDYSKMLKPGGILVYATCSILPSENQKQIEKFLNNHKNEFEFMEDRKVMPSEGFDGFYMARIKKKG